jgi:hypothetical protein
MLLLCCPDNQIDYNKCVVPKPFQLVFHSTVAGHHSPTVCAFELIKLLILALPYDYRYKTVWASVLQHAAQDTAQQLDNYSTTQSNNHFKNSS